MKFLYALVLPVFLTLATHGASFPYITLSGKTNRLADNGSAFTRDGVAIGGATVGTVINTVAPFAAGVPLGFRGTDTTNAIPLYTSGLIQYITGNHSVLYTDNRAILRHADATNTFETFTDGATNGFEVIIKNLGAGSVIVTNTAGKTFDSLTSITFPAGTVAAIRGDGTNYITGRISPKTISAGNLVYASDSAGASSVPTMRALVTADLPAIIIVTNFTTIPTAVAYASTITDDFSGGGDLTTILTGSTTLAASNQSNGRGIVHSFFNGAATNCNVVLPSTWRIQSGAVTNILGPGLSATCAMKYYSYITNTVVQWASE